MITKAILSVTKSSYHEVANECSIECRLFQVFSNIKHQGTLYDCPRHLYDQIDFAREACTAAELDHIKFTIQANAFMANPENVILSMAGMFNS